jgi:diadenosine tetraphosphate (Ap4A) HIT family hydrolase
MANPEKAQVLARQEILDPEANFQDNRHCPFCAITSAFPPVDPLDDPEKIAEILTAEKTDPPATMVYSGEHVLALLDIQPLTWGHTLVIPRKHRAKMGDLEAADAAEVSES